MVAVPAPSALLVPRSACRDPCMDSGEVSNGISVASTGLDEHGGGLGSDPKQLASIAFSLDSGHEKRNDGTSNGNAIFDAGGKPDVAAVVEPSLSIARSPDGKGARSGVARFNRCVLSNKPCNDCPPGTPGIATSEDCSGKSGHPENEEEETGMGKKHGGIGAAAPVLGPGC